MAGIPDEVRSFIDRYINSVERLEILLLLQRYPDRQWTADAVASELRISSASADLHLAKLCSYSLLDVRIGKDLFYWYRPRLPHLEHAARVLATVYREQRFAVINLIQERPPESIRDFAEAFRLTRKDESDG